MSILDTLPPVLPYDDFVEQSRVYLEPPRYQSKYGRVKFCEIDEPGQEHEFIVDGLMSVGDKSIIGGASMSGKTFLALHLAMSVTRGVDFLGVRVLRPGLVIYIAGEGARGLKKRIRAYRKHHGIDPKEDIPFDLLTRKVDLFSADGDTKGLIAECHAIAEERGQPVSMIFLDTFATASGNADENSGKDCATVLGHVDEIERATGAHICIVHHFNAAGTKLRGHSSLLANIDQVLEVSCNPVTKVRTARLAKQKDGEDNVKFQFELMSVEVGRRPDDNKPITSCVVLPVGEKEAARKEFEREGYWLKDDMRPAFKAVLDGRKKAGRFADSELEEAGVKPGVVAVHYRDWREAYISTGPCGDNGEPLSDGAIQKRLERFKNRLVALGVLGWARPWIWHTGKAIKGFPETFERGERPGDVLQTETRQVADAWSALDEAPGF